LLILLTDKQKDKDENITSFAEVKTRRLY